MKSSNILLEVISESDKSPLVLRLISYIESLEEKLETMHQAMEVLQTRLHTLEEQNELLISENKRLKNLPQKPKIEASALNKDGTNKDGEDDPSSKTAPDKEPVKKNKNHKSRSKNKNIVIHKTEVITIENPPEGAILKDYQICIIQDIAFHTKNTELKLARYKLPDGTYLTAKKPAHYDGQFGPTLKAFVDVLHYGGRVTQGRIHDLLTSVGVDISSGQISRLLNHNRDDFIDEKDELLAVGLGSSDYIQTDDTTAKHNGKSGYCLFIGNEKFSWFESTDTKNRLNFLTCLNQGNLAFILNEHALTYCRTHKLPKKYMDVLTTGIFDTLEDFLDYLESTGMTSKHHLQLMTEAALIGNGFDKRYLTDLKILSDDAGQFSITDKNALCWVHAERPLKKLVALHPQNAQEIESALTQFWQIYTCLKAYKIQQTPKKRLEIEALFDQLCALNASSDALIQALKKLASNRHKLLLVLDYPSLPLHNNAAEGDIREYVMRRKISGSTRSEWGRTCRDTFVSLKKTCVKQGIRFWDFLIDRHMQLNTIPKLHLLVSGNAIVPQ